jgi:hypothetical protein
MKFLLLVLLALLPACAAQVTHPTKSETEMRADIKLCTDRANHKYWMDPVAALYNAYDCLEARGYSRDRSGLAGQVEQAVGEGRAKGKAAPAQPCRVPCGRRRPGA